MTKVIRGRLRVLSQNDEEISLEYITETDDGLIHKSISKYKKDCKSFNAIKYLFSDKESIETKSISESVTKSLNKLKKHQTKYNY